MHHFILSAIYQHSSGCMYIVLRRTYSVHIRCYEYVWGHILGISELGVRGAAEFCGQKGQGERTHSNIGQRGMEDNIGEG